MKPKIILVGTALGQPLRKILPSEYNLVVVSNTNGALAALRNDQISAILVDHVNSPSHKLEAIRELRAAYPDLKIISIGVPEAHWTQYSLPGYDWVNYPLDRDNLVLKLRQACQCVAKSPMELDGSIIGSSPAMMKVFQVMKKTANVDCPVLICGEHGTGKELVAQFLHFKSLRRNDPFIPVSCSALAPNLLESELFGHEKGAFTGAIRTTKGRFERAGRGTIFLDEIADLSQSLQVKLLRVLQEREFEKVGGSSVLNVIARVIAATNRDMEKAVREGTFREDLYYRLNVINIFLPPLRCRLGDIPLLARHFLKKYGKSCGKNEVSIGNEAMEALKKYSWRGNVRELENQIWRAVSMCEDDVITPKDFSFGFRGTLLERRRVTINRGVGELLLPEAVESVERRMICDALKKASYVKTKAARALGITERMLSYKMRKWDISAKGNK